ncbi:hypothetical protein [Nocardia terpenica]|nr:hypothetical protein [Nocardia terpenica]NQE86292.1 hypothetical protein [Nocardia terpenica]
MGAALVISESIRVGRDYAEMGVALLDNRHSRIKLCAFDIDAWMNR